MASIGKADFVSAIHAVLHDGETDPLIKLTRLRRALHTYYRAEEPIPMVEIAHLMMWMYSTGVADYDHELKSELFVDNNNIIDDTVLDTLTSAFTNALQRTPCGLVRWSDDAMKRFISLTCKPPG
jgi:hypothetical protein